MPYDMDALHHYRILDNPEVEYVINFSGGASSGYMLAHMALAYDGVLPRNVHVVFCNTGLEREETLRFIHEFAVHFGLRIVWVEYFHKADAKGGLKDPKHCHTVVGYNSASRNGEPFKMLIDAKRMLPNRKRRICTAELKGETVRRYLRRELGIKKKIIHIVGFRFDEPGRWQKEIWQQCDRAFPMVPARVRKPDVRKFWNQMPFKLGIESYQGNCTLCFLKTTSIKKRIIREEGPEVAEWWLEAERSVAAAREKLGISARSTAVFSPEYTVQELVDSADDGQVDFIEDPSFDCWCGD